VARQRVHQEGPAGHPRNLGGNKDGDVFAAALEPNGEVLLAGCATVARNTTDMAVVRLMV
jgi:hypothetical protein